MSRSILLAEIMHETNTFNRTPTVRADFDTRYYLTGDEIPQRLRDTNTEIWGVLTEAGNLGWSVTHPLAASASPSGPMAAGDWDEVKDLILAPLRNGRCFDGIILIMHGSMVTATTDDAEGDLLEAARSLAGPSCPIIVTLDMHANVSRRMVDASTLMLAYRTYPHVDQFERGRHAIRLLKRILDEGLQPVQHFLRRPMMDAADHGQTASGPMPQLLALADEIETDPDVLCASIQIGFPWSDVPDIGPSVIVTGTGNNDTAVQAHAERLMEAVWQSRAETTLAFPGPNEAIAEAMAGKPGEAPLILADFADNPAGGAYGDSPNLLRHMLQAGLVNAAFATISDPEAVQIARTAGEGATIDVALGGKGAPDLTPPLETRAKVLKLNGGTFVCEGPMWKGVAFSMGPTAVLGIEGVEVVVSSVPTAVMDPQVFRSVGIEPSGKTTIGLKSRNHFKAAYEPIARKVMLVDAGGIASMQLNTLTYHKIPRPIWPLDAD